MKFNVKTDDLHKVKTELLVIPLPPLKYADNKFLELDKLCNHFLSKIARENQIDGNIGANILLHSVENVLARSILLVGISKNGDCDLSEFKKTMKPCINQIGKLKKKSVAVQILQDKSKQNEFAEKCRFIFKEFETVTYSYKKQLNGNLTILTNSGPSKSLMKISKEGFALANGIRLTKNLAKALSTIVYKTEESSPLTGKDLPTSEAEPSTSLMVTPLACRTNSASLRIVIERDLLELLLSESVAVMLASYEDLVSKSGACLKDNMPVEERLRLLASVPVKDHVTDSLAV